MTTTTQPTTTPAQDRATAQRIATGLVTEGLRAIFTTPYVESGHEHYAKDVRAPRRGDSIDGLVTFNAVDDATGQVMAVTVMVHATPLPARLCTVYGQDGSTCTREAGHQPLADGTNHVLVVTR